MRLRSASLKLGAIVSSVGVFGAAFLWLLSFKIVASWMGPEGVGLFSQLRQVAQAATVGATFGGTNSVVQGLAEREDELERQKFRSTAFRLVGLTGLCVVLLMAAIAPQLTYFFLSSDAPNLVATVRWVALAVLFNVGGTYALAVLNGYRSYSCLAFAQIAGPATLVMLLAGAWWQHLPPDPQLLAVAFVLCFGVTCLVGTFGVSRLSKPAPTFRAEVLSKEQSRTFIRFALSNLGGALATTIALLMIRSWIIEAKGLAFSGLFDAGWTLTFNYTTLFLTACSAIYLPLLTAAANPQSQQACMLKAAYLVLGVSLVICYGMVLAAEPLINLLYSPEFQASGQVVGVLAIAVIFRGVSWVLGTMILATRNSRALLASDLAVNLLLLATTRYALDSGGSLEALSWAFVLPNFVYLVFVVEYAAKKNRLMRRRLIWPFLAWGVSPLVYLALASVGSPWANPTVTWLCIAMGLTASGASLLAYKKVVL